MSETMLSQAPAQQTNSGAAPAQVATEQPKQPQATDGKTNGSGQPAEVGKPEATEAPKAQAGAPEKYEFVSPEGVAFDEAVLKHYSEVAKELNLPQEAAQKVIDRLAPVMHQRQAEQIAATRTEWENASKADKEFGGQNLDANLSVARKALDTFGSPELRALLNESGLGNHPEIIRAFYKAGQAISEDRFVGGQTTTGRSGGPKSFNDFAASLYPNQSN